MGAIDHRRSASVQGDRQRHVQPSHQLSSCVRTSASHTSVPRPATWPQLISTFFGCPIFSLPHKTLPPMPPLTPPRFILPGQRCARFTRRNVHAIAILYFVSLFLTRIPQFRLQVMNADRFDGPYSNLCDAPATAASDSNSDQLYTASQVPPLQPAIPFFYFYFY